MKVKIGTRNHKLDYPSSFGRISSRSTENSNFESTCSNSKLVLHTNVHLLETKENLTLLQFERQPYSVREKERFEKSGKKKPLSHTINHCALGC